MNMNKDLDLLNDGALAMIINDIESDDEDILEEKVVEWKYDSFMKAKPVRS